VTLWIGILGGAVACYALKFAGLSVPPRVLANARVQRVGDLLPVALLSTLIVTGTFADGRHLVVDARLAGVVAGAVAQWRRAPFLVVVAVAALTAALLRAI
jgi:branched-subunit amino acid transport protein